MDWSVIGLAALAGCVGGAMNALAGGGAFATMPALVGIGLPATIANATSNVAMQPAAMASAWTYRRGLAPLGGLSIRLLNSVNFVAALVGSYLLVVTPPTAFDVIVPGCCSSPSGRSPRASAAPPGCVPMPRSARAR